jgi:hypothetical protein
LAHDEEVEMPILRQLDLRGGATRGIGLDLVLATPATQSLTAATVTVQRDASDVGKLDVT